MAVVICKLNCEIFFRSVVRGTHVENTQHVVYRQTASPCELVLSEAMPLLLDGDLVEPAHRFRLEVLPRHLRFVIADSS